MADDDDDDVSKISVIGAKDSKPAAKKSKVTLQPAGMSSGGGSRMSSRARAVRLADMTKPLLMEERKAMVAASVRRIFKAEKASGIAGVPDVRFKVLTSLAAMYSSDLKSVFLDYIFEDLPGRSDLALSWLFEEYCYFQGFNRTSAMLNRRNDGTEYDSIILALIRGVIKMTEGKEREELLRRFYLEPPIITEEAIKLLKKFVLIEGTAITVVNLMKDLVMRRPTKKLHLLNFLLEFCSHDIPEVRETANETVLRLHADGDFNKIIEEFSVMYLKFLLSPTPPPMLFGEDRGRMVVSNVWSEDIIKVCLYLYLSLLPQNLKLFHHLTEVYKTAGGDIKRTILRVLDFPVRNIDMNSSELLDMIENCPKGSETLVTRIINILTDKAMPTPALVEKVRDLYETRFPDVRFLIPVLNGLSKKEIVHALPKLIKLNPVVVQQVFSRLLNTANGGPVSAADLLIALHNMDPAKSDMKTVIKATSLCFQDKAVYTEEVLAIVLQQLMEQAAIPLLFMRTVIQERN
jgi:symplekin